MSTKIPPPSVTAGDNANIEYGQQHVRGRKNVAVGPGGRITGSFNKKLSFRIGTIKVNLPLGPVAVAAVILLGGGGTAAVVAHENTAPSALVKQAAGTWTLARSQSAGAGGRITAGSLTISPKGVYQVDMTIALDPADAFDTTANESGLNLPALNAETSDSCGGEVTSREQVLIFTPFDHSPDNCTTFTGTVRAATLTLGNGRTAIRFQRA